MPVSSACRVATILAAIVLKRPLALCDIGDFDGIACAALFKMTFPKGLVVLAAPSDVRRSPLIRHVSWAFIADLPCPGKALLRADHHDSNPPCAAHEYYDPSAPASALLALSALGLEGSERARRLVDLAIDTDTAQMSAREATLLNNAVKGSGYLGKLRLIKLLSERAVEEVLEDPRVRGVVNRYSRVVSLTEEFAERLPIKDHVIVVFRRRLPISCRYLCILLERRGARLTAAVVPRGLRGVRVYLGSSSPQLNVARVAEELGGGGHPYAAGAELSALSREKAVRRVLEALARHVRATELRFYLVEREGDVTVREWPYTRL